MPLIPKPSPTPLWGNAAAGGDLVDPSSGQKNTGWIANQIPPHQTFNWFQNYVQQGVLNWMQNGLPVWDAADTYPVGAFVRDAGDGNYYFATGATTVGLAPHLDLTHWSNPFGSIATSNYTGNPAGAEAPDTGPVLGGAPIVQVPTSGALIQPLKALADWAAFTAGQLNVPAVYWGDGSDGDLHVTSGTTTIVAAKNYNNVTVDAGGILIVKNAPLRVRGTLTVDAAGVIHCNGDAAVTGSGLAAFGNDTIANTNTTSYTIGGGASGGIAPAHRLSSAVWVPTSGVGFLAGGAGAGGTGGSGTDSSGAGSTTSGASGGPVGAPLSPTFPGDLYHPGFVFGRTGFSQVATSSSHFGNPDFNAAGVAPVDPLKYTPFSGVTIMLEGGSGGGAGAGAGGPSGGDTDTIFTAINGWGWTTGGPGCGGAGGGFIWISARHANLGSATCIRAFGGNGANGTNNTVHSGQAQGGGAGGGGGRVHFYYGVNIGIALTNACVAGGTGGTAVNGGTAGTNGGTGVLQYIQVPM